MNRRDFFARLAALPLIGGLFRSSAAGDEWDRLRRSVKQSSEDLAPILGVKRGDSARNLVIDWWPLVHGRRYKIGDLPRSPVVGDVMFAVPILGGDRLRLADSLIDESPVEFRCTWFSIATRWAKFVHRSRGLVIELKIRRGDDQSIEIDQYVVRQFDEDYEGQALVRFDHVTPAD